MNEVGTPPVGINLFAGPEDQEGGQSFYFNCYLILSDRGGDDIMSKDLFCSEAYETTDACIQAADNLMSVLEQKQVRVKKTIDFKDAENTKKMNRPPSEDAIEFAAKIAHEANAVYCSSIGDPMSSPWEKAPEWQKESCRKGVKAIACKLLKDEKIDPEVSHDGWLEHKWSEGWKYGPVKDEKKKEHPCMVPYNELPSKQRHKDVLFCRIVEMILLDSR